MTIDEALEGVDVSIREAKQELANHGFDDIQEKNGWLWGDPGYDEMEQITKVKANGMVDSADIMHWLGY